MLDCASSLPTLPWSGPDGKLTIGFLEAAFLWEDAGTLEGVWVASEVEESTPTTRGLLSWATGRSLLVRVVGGKCLVQAARESDYSDIVSATITVSISACDLACALALASWRAIFLACS